MLTVFTASAFSGERGEFEFLNSCAQCHVADGQGAGPISQYLEDETPPITSSSKNNSGVFPVEYVIRVLEGTVDIGVHRRDMLLLDLATGKT